MRVLVLSHNYRNVGTWFRAWHIARGYSERGHDVVFMHTGRQRFSAKKIQQDNLTIWETPCYSHLFNQQEGWGGIDWLSRTSKVIGGRFDLILCFGHKPNILLPARHCRFWQKSVVLADWCDWWGGPEGLIHQTLLRSTDYLQSRFYQCWARKIGFKIEEKLEQNFCRKAHGATTICRYLEDACLNKGIPQKLIRNIYSGCDTQSIQVENMQQCRDELQLPRDKKILGYMANFQPDQPMLLKAFAEIYRQRKDVLLLSAGASFADEMLQLHAPDCREQIIQLGYLPFEKVTRLLGAADLLMLPMADVLLNRARWPHKFTDYLCAGRPVIANDVGDPPAFIEKHNAGKVAQADPTDLANKTLQALRDAELLKSQGENARKLAEDPLSWKNQFEEFYDFANSIIENQK